MTTKDKEEAKKIGRAMVQEQLAACANIVDGMNSIYIWNGELCDDSEAVLILKSKMALFGQLESRIKELHSYENPCIISFKIIDGSTEYLSWINEQTLKGI